MRPKVVMLENTPVFASCDKGKALQLVKDVAKAIGYSLVYAARNAAEFVRMHKTRGYVTLVRDDLVQALGLPRF